MSERDPLDVLARGLFEAARSEQPQDEARRRAARGHEHESGAALALELAVSRSRRARALRWVPACATALALAAAAWLALDAQLRPADRESFSIAPERLPEPERDANARNAVSAESEHRGPDPEPLSVVGEPSRALKAAAGRTAPRPRPTASLAEEVALLDRARSALAAGDARDALALVEQYERVLRGTRLGAEAALLRIEALAASGQRAQAAERARRFVAEHPGSPLADRARALGQIVAEEGGGR